LNTAWVSALVLGLVVGIPYYALPFFFDYMERPLREGGQGWSRSAIQLGLPLGTFVTLAIGPWLAPKVPPRTGIAAGALVCGLALVAMGFSHGSLAVYYASWMLYMFGWTFAGPMSHHVLLSQVYDADRRGGAIAWSLFGISAFGAFSVAGVARPLTLAWGYEAALSACGVAVLLAAPLAWFGLPPSGTAAKPSLRTTSRRSVADGNSLWMWLAAGGSLTAAGIAGVSQHLKLILAERGFTNQVRLDEVYGWTVMVLLGMGALGRFVFAWAARQMPLSRVVALAFLCMLVAMPLLWFVGDDTGTRISPYWFALVFGFGMSADSLLVSMLAASHYGPARMAGPMAIIVPVTTVAQTWSPYAVGLLVERYPTGAGAAGSDRYGLPLIAVFACILTGRFLLSRAAAMAAAQREEEAEVLPIHAGAA